MMQLSFTNQRTYLLCLGMLVTSDLPLLTSCSLFNDEASLRTSHAVRTVHAEKKESQLVLFAGLENGMIEIFSDFNDSKPTRCYLKGHSAPVNAMSSHDQHYLFSSSIDQTFCIWDIKKAKCLFQKNKLPCTGIKSMGKLLFISTANGSVQMWDWGNRLLMRTLEVPDKGKITSFALSENGQFLFVASGCNNLYVWDLTTGNSAPFNTTKGGGVNTLLCQNYTLLIGTRYGEIKSWEWRFKEMPPQYLVGNLKADVMSLSVREGCLYAGLSNRSVEKWIYSDHISQSEHEKVGHIGDKMQRTVISMCYEDAQWFFSTENQPYISYIKEKKEGSISLFFSKIFESKKNNSKEKPVNRPTPSDRTIRQLNAAQRGWLTNKQMLDYFTPFVDMFFGTNPEVLKKFTPNALKEEWLEAIRLADRKKVDALLNPEYRNPKTSSLDLIRHMDKQNRNILHFAVLKGNVPLLRYLFNTHKKKLTPILNQPTKQGLSPMDIAYETNCMTALFLLHNNGAKLVRHAPKSSPIT